MNQPADGNHAAEQRTFPMKRTCPFSPPEEYAVLRETEPVARASLKVNGKPAWLITKHEHIKKVLADPRVSSNLKLPGYPLQVPVPDELVQSMPLTFVSMDPPEHTAQRRMLAPEFTLRQIRTLRPRIQEIVDQQIDAMLAGGGPVDLVTTLALPVPSLVISELLGVPYEAHHQFEQWAAQIMDREISDEDRGKAHYELEAYVDQLVTTKESHPGDDLISRLIAKNRVQPTVDHTAIASMARVILITGHETTANMIALGTLALLEHPDQLNEIKKDPALLPKAVEELLRYFSISDSGTARVALEDIEIDGQIIRAGEGILPLNNSANHDDAVFPNADTLDIHREARGHLAFGYGIHQCVGQSLARVELEIVFTTLFARIPELRLAAPIDQIQFKDAMVYGIHALPVTWPSPGASSLRGHDD